MERKGSISAFDLDINKGEVHGLAGLLGSGRTEIARLLFGIDRPSKGKTWLNGRDVSITDYSIAEDGNELRDQIAQTGRVPSGTYVFVVEVRRPLGVLLGRGEGRVQIGNPSRVLLLSPGTPLGVTPPTVNTTALRFIWTTDGAVAQSLYSLRVVRTDGAVSPEEAMQGRAVWQATTTASSELYPASAVAERLEPVFAQKYLHGKVGGCAEAGYPDRLASQILNALDLRRGHDVESGDVDDRSHGDQVAALETDIGDHLAVGGRDRHLAGEHGIGHDRGARNVDHVGLEPLLLQEARLLDHPERGVERAHGGPRHYELLRLGGLRQRERQGNNKERKNFRLLHLSSSS